MNRKRMVWVVFRALCGLMLMSSAVYAVQADDTVSIGAGEKSGKMEGRMKRIEKDLGLTADQQKRLEEHRKAHREEAKKLRGEMRQKKEALRAELEKPDLNVDKVKAANAALKEIQGKLADHRLDGILEVRKILTPEQFKKFRELTGKEWNRRGQHRRKGPPEGSPEGSAE